MKLPSAKISVAGLMLAASPSSAAPQSVEDACWRYANRVTPHSALTAPPPRRP